MPVQRGGQVLRVQGRVWADSGFGLEVVNGASGDGEVRWFGSRSIILGQVLIAERIAGNDDGLGNYGGDEARLDACAGLATLAPGFFHARTSAEQNVACFNGFSLQGCYRATS